MPKSKEPKQLSDALSAVALEIARSIGYNEAQSVERVLRAVARGQQKKDNALFNAIIESIDVLTVNDRRALVVEINRRYGKE